MDFLSWEQSSAQVTWDHTPEMKSQDPNCHDMATDSSRWESTCTNMSPLNPTLTRERGVPMRLREVPLTQAERLDVLLTPSLLPSPRAGAMAGRNRPAGLLACSLRALNVCGDNCGVRPDAGAMGSRTC